MVNIVKFFMYRIDHDKRSLSFDETNVAKKQQIVPTRHLDTTTTDERVSFSLEKELPDDDKDEIVYSSTSNMINDNNNNNDDEDDNDNDNDDDEQVSARANGNSSNASSEETTDEEEADDDINDESDNEEERNNEDDESVLKLDKSKNNSITDISKRIYDKKTFAEQKQYISIDSGHIQSESPSPVDLSPSSASPINQQVLTSKKSDTITYSYFRAPCPVCRGSTYDDATTIEIGKQYYHKTCLHCYSCDKQLKDNEYNYHDLASDGTYNFYCTLHFCKSRLKQVTTRLAVVTQQESQSKTIYPNLSKLRSNTTTQWHNNLRLYPSLKDALSPKPHPLNVANISDNKTKQQNIGFEHIRQSISNPTNKNSSPKLTRSKTFDETLSLQLSDNDENLNINSKQENNDLGKQRFKRRGQNRPSSPISTNNSQIIVTNNLKSNETNSITTSINRKKKRILIPQSNLNLSSSSSQSLDDERKRSSNERRRQREERQKELVRFRRSQEIQRELEEIEQKRIELDKRHTIARQNLNLSTNDEKKKAYWERECLCIVRERTALQRSEDELIMTKSGLTLENERARAENEYRQLINLPDELKTTKDKEREEQLITTIAKLVETRNNLTIELDQMRLRELQEDECLRHVYQLHGIEHQTTSSSAYDTLKDII
ncbi:unnamed protein product [Rotaria sp. Silwood1]|nr:unnamed protein product [Rotaria sp. Silwood1]CAF0838062.1 unnamed protein product [Rotaria sp. Silwood1]CAF3400292.1 unnamed protein product [Rotaria sp. Silwood1]CAF3403897.1 unnamed protein product [Rotaria sp. Silwood1]CAF4498051.1 unnamed protein product [Rotaria sp. Silwood1]